MGTVDRVIVRNRCDWANVGGRFGPMVADAVAVYRDIFGDRIVDVRLLGSVARGESALWRSDIDFVGLVDGLPSDEEIQALEERAKGLGMLFPVVSRFDLEAEAAEGLAPFRRFVLSSDSIRVFGSETVTTLTQTMEREELIALVTPDAATMIGGYRSAIEALGEAPNDADLLFWNRIVGKDILKCLRGTVIRLGGEYEVNIGGIHGQVAEYAPSWTALADVLYRCYRDADSGRRELLAVLDSAERIILTEKPS